MSRAEGGRRNGIQQREQSRTRHRSRGRNANQKQEGGSTAKNSDQGEELEITKPHFHDFYAEKKDAEKILCIYDSEFSLEKVEMPDLSPQQLSKIFKVREISKRFYGDQSHLVRILIFKPAVAEEETIYLEKPFIWQNLRKFITCVDQYDLQDPTMLVESRVGCKGLNKIYPLQVDFVDRKTRYSYTPGKFYSRHFYLAKNLILAAAKRSLL